MAEAVAVVNIVANVLQLVDFALKVIHRLDEFQSFCAGIPKSYRQIRAELPILTISLQRLKDGMHTGSIRESEAAALLPAVQGCQDQISELDNMSLKMRPQTTESRGKKSPQNL
jgi:hypothetical protein